jgi:hypothetical protein
MIGSYGRNAYGGRVGGKRNTKVYTISPKGGTIKLVKAIGSINIPKSVGKIRVKKSIGGVIKG